MKAATKTNALTTPPTEDGFGFHGAIRRNENLDEAEAEAAWECAMETIADAAGGNAILARNFLRNRIGRHAEQ